MNSGSLIDGLVDEAWRICYDTANPDLVFSQTFKATAVGTALFAGHAPDNPYHEILYTGLTELLPVSEVSFGSVELVVTEVVPPADPPVVSPADDIPDELEQGGTRPLPILDGPEWLPPANPVGDEPVLTAPDEGSDFGILEAITVALDDFSDNAEDEVDTYPPAGIDSPLLLAAVAPRVGAATVTANTAANAGGEIRLVDVSPLNLQRLQLLFRPVASGVLDFQVSGGSNRRVEVEEAPQPRREEKPATESALVTR